MRVCLIVDNPQRDLSGIVLLARSLCERGAVCYLVPVNLQWMELGALRPDFVLLNYLRTVNEDLAKGLLRAGSEVGVLDTEGGVFSSLDRYARILGRADEVRSQVACFCSWGRRLAELAVREKWYREDQVRVTGSPRFDFYAAPWRQAARDLCFTGAAVDERPMVLINGSYSVANPRFMSADKELRFLVERVGEDEARLKRFQRVQRKTMLAMARLANHLARRFPDATVVYRPHPFERTETYHELLERLDNLHLVADGTVDRLILNASVVIQRSCSTAIEASLAGVPSLSPTWIPTPEEIEIVEAVSIPCSSPDELDQVVAAALSNGSVQPRRSGRDLMEVIGDWFHTVDGRAHERVRDAILESRTAGRDAPSLSVLRRIHYEAGCAGIGLMGRVTKTARLSLRLPVNWSFHRWRRVEEFNWDRSAKRFSCDEVQRLVRALEEAAPSSEAARRPEIRVCPAEAEADYSFGYSGRSVRLQAAPCD